MITQLGYVGFGVKRLDDWIALMSLFGLSINARGDDGSVQLGMDDRLLRVAIHPSGEDDVAYLGWQTQGAADMKQLVASVAAAGIRVHEADADLAAKRCVQGLAWFVDPNGLRTELFWGPKVRSAPFVPARAISGFKAGTLGVGHAVIAAADREGAERFYVDVLGLKVTDYGSGPLVFLRCNARHHSIAFIPSQHGFAGKKMVHLMVEVNSIDDVGSGLDACLKAGVPLTETLGRHVNDHMVSFYLRSPSGFDLEYGWGGVMVDEATWEVRRYMSKDIWGHQRTEDFVKAALPAQASVKAA